MTPEQQAAAKERHKQKVMERYRERRAQREEWRAAGICTNCGKRRVISGYVTCEVCSPHKGAAEKRANALTEAEHELEEINNKRRAAGLPTLTYGQWQQKGGRIKNGDN